MALFKYSLLLELFSMILNLVNSESLEFEVHKYDGTCLIDRVCTYTLKVPVRVDVKLQMEIDSRAFDISTHLESLDLTINMIQQIVGDGKSSPMAEAVAKQLTTLKNESNVAQNLFNGLRDKMHQITADDIQLESQLSVINATILDQLVDPCLAKPCTNDGICERQSDNSFKCNCKGGWTGKLCDTDINECASSPCFNLGTCVNEINHFNCLCSPDFTGKRCEERVQDCRSGPCLLGKCVKGFDTYQCVCNSPLITGKLCDKAPKRDCSDLRSLWNYTKDKIYTITEPDGSLTLARCDMTTDGGGWTVFQRRVDNSTSFSRLWKEYRDGFGDMNGNFWWGLDQLYNVTKGRNDIVLRIDVLDWQNNTAFAEYNNFSIADVSDFYSLHVGGYRGTAGDALNFEWENFNHNGMRFSTPDKDNDKSPDNCAGEYKSAFWYNNCFSANPNGIYYSAGQYKDGMEDGIEWFPWKRRRYSLKKIEMKFRSSVAPFRNKKPFETA